MRQTDCCPTEYSTLGSTHPGDVPLPRCVWETGRVSQTDLSLLSSFHPPTKFPSQAGLPGPPLNSIGGFEGKKGEASVAEVLTPLSLVGLLAVWLVNIPASC